MTVYRVQDRDGRGPWKPGFSHKWVRDSDDVSHYTPMQFEFPILFDAMVRFPHEYVGCGAACRTVEQLRGWFDPTEYATLLKHGYRAVELDADRILAESKIQVVFQRSRRFTEGAKEFELYPHR